MPGTLLLDDWRNAVQDQLKQHVEGLQSGARQALQVIQDVPRPDPGQVAQQLQQTAQQALIPLQQPQVQQPTAPVVMQQLTDLAGGLFSAQPHPPALSPAPSTVAGVQPLAQPTPSAPIAPSAAVAPPALGAGMPNVQIDASSPEAFIRSVTPAAQWVQQQTGIPAEAMIAMAANETGYGKAAPGSNLFGIKGQGPAGSTTSPTWEDYGQGRVNITDTFRRYNNATESFQDFVQFLRDNPRYRNVMALVDQGRADTGSFVQGLKDAGYMTDPNYVGKIQSIVGRYQPLIDEAKSAVGGAVQPAIQAGQGALRDISQFGDAALTNAEAYAACGPAAAVRFAERFGRNPTLREAVDLAKQVGWSVAQGMAGITSQKALMDKLGVATKIVSDVATMAREALSGNPVTISTPFHYFYADGYDPQSGSFHVGRSGTDLRGGKEWMTQADIQSLGRGAIQGALLADSPLVPSKSAATIGGPAPKSQPDVIVVGDQARAPIYHGAMIPGGLPPGGGGGDDDRKRTGLQVLGDAVGQVAGDIQRAGGGFFSDVGAGAQGVIQDVSRGAQDLGRQIGPNLGFDDAELQRRRQALEQTPPVDLGGKAVPEFRPLPPDQYDAGTVLGTGAQGLVGQPFGQVQSPEQIRAAQKSATETVATPVSEALGNVKLPGQTEPVPVLQGLSTMLIEQAFANPLLFVPGAPMAAEFNNIGRAIIADIAPRAPAIVARFGTGAINGGLQNAILAAGEKDADPLSVGTAFFVGAGAGGVLETTPRLALDVGQAILRRLPEITPILERAVRSRQPAQAEVGFALGMGPDRGGAPRSLDELQARHPNVELQASEASRGITLSMIRTPADQQRTGLATAAMRDLIAYADSVGKPIALTPERVGSGMSKSALTDWYGQFGFRSNKGRGGDPTFRETMIRDPLGTPRMEPEAPAFRAPEGPAAEPGVPATRVYHGTTSDFDRVRTDLPAVEGENTLGPGYYVTPNPDYASMYAKDVRGHYDEPSHVGANVRAIDLPSDAKLFDLQTADDVTPDEIDRLTQVLRTRDPERAATLEHVKQAVVDAGGEATDLASPDALWRYLTTGRNALSVTEANRLIERAGYDGIRGGDEGTVIFGSSVNKLRNAISGRQGGQAQLPFATNIAGAAFGGYAGNVATPEDASPEERLRNIGIGATTGLLGTRAITGSGPGRLAEAIAGRARTAQEPAGAFRAPERPELRTTLQEPPGAAGGMPLEEPGGPRPRSIQDVQSNPYGLREPRPGETPMSTDEMVNYADELDTRLEDVQNRANAVDEMLRNPARKVERPPWGAGYTNVQLAEIARRHDISPYQENWWDRVGLETGSGEVRENVGESNLRGTPSQRELSTTDLRAEKARLDKEAADILAAHDQMASAPAGAQLVRPTQAAVTPPGELPFDMPGAAEQTPEPVPVTEAQGGRDEGARLAQEVVLSKGRGRLTSTPGEVVGEQGDITGRAILSPERAAEINATPPSARTAANMPNLDAMLEGDMPEVAAQIRKAAEDNPELFEKYRQGVISFDSLRNDLAARTGMAMKDWLKTPVGKGFNEREMMALQAAAVEAQGRLQDMGDSIMARGGVDALTPEQVAYGLAELVDTQRLLAVARGGRSTAGRTLNVLKQRFDRTLASSITAGAEAIAKRRDAQTARRAAVKATRLLTKGRELEVESQTAVANASRTPGTPRNIVDQIAEAYDQLDRYQAMTLHEKGEVATQLAKERATRAAARKAAVANRGAPEELLSALKAELKAEQDIFAGRKDNWETQAFWDTQANEIAAEKRNAFRGQLYLEQQRRVAQIAAKEADQGSKRAFDAELRRKTNQSQKAEVLLKAIGGQEVGKDLLKQFLAAQADPDPYAAAKFIKGMASQNNWVRANIIRVAGLVSAPITHMVNLGGNTALAMVEQVAVRPTVVLIDAVRAGMTGGERQAYRAELLPAMQAYGPGFLGALPNAVRLLKTGIHPADTVDLTKVRPGFASGSDVVDAAVEMPLRALGAEDILFRSGAVSYHGMRVGMRQAIREGFQGEAAKGRAANILKNLEEYPELAQEVNDAAARDVFQEKRGIGRLGFNESQNVALARSQVLPFVRTPMNITAQGAAMSPLGVVGTVQAARASRVGMTVAQSGRQTLLAEERLARTLIGTGIFGAGLALGGAGMLTADYPQDRTTLPPGWRPWSMKLDDPISGNTYYVPLQNIGPMGFPLAMSAILTDPIHQGKTVLDPDEQMNAATAIGRYVIDNTFLQGINDFNDLLHDPRQGAAKFAEPWAASFGPYSSLMRELNRTFGVASRNPHEGLVGLVDAMEANYPGLAGNVPEATTALGEPRTQGATGLGRLVPLRYDIARDEPLLKQLREAGVAIPQAPKAVNYASGHIELSEQEQDQLKRARGAAIRKAITSYTNDPQFQALSRDKRNYYLRDLVSQATAQANMQFLFDLPEGSINSRWKPREIPEPYYLGGATG